MAIEQLWNGNMASDVKERNEAVMEHLDSLQVTICTNCGSRNETHGACVKCCICGASHCGD